MIQIELTKGGHSIGFNNSKKSKTSNESYQNTLKFDTIQNSELTFQGSWLHFSLGNREYLQAT